MPGGVDEDADEDERSYHNGLPRRQHGGRSNAAIELSVEMRQEKGEQKGVVRD